MDPALRDASKLVYRVQTCAKGRAALGASPGGDQPGARIEDEAALVAVVRRQRVAQAVDGTSRLAIAQARERRAHILKPPDAALGDPLTVRRDMQLAAPTRRTASRSDIARAVSRGTGGGSLSPFPASQWSSE